MNVNNLDMRARISGAYRHFAAAVAAVLALTVLGAVPGTAHADGPRMTIVPSAHTAPLSLSGFGAIVADDATHSVFVSSGGSGDGVEEIGYDGTVLGTLGHEEGADGLALSADGRTLYVALAKADAVSVIDTATFTEQARYPMPRHSCPMNLARTGADVWIGYGCGGGASASGEFGTGGVAVLATDVSSPEVVAAKVVSGARGVTAGARYSAAPIVAASGQALGTVVVSRAYANPTTVSTYTTSSSGREPSLTLVHKATLSGSELADLAVSPDGATAYAALGSQTAVEALAAATLAESGEYTTGLGPDAVAVSADGAEFASTTAIPGSHVYVWRAGDASGSGPAAGDYGRPESGAPAPRGLAFSGDGRLLFFVTEPPSGQGGPTLTVLEVDQD